MNFIKMKNFWVPKNTCKKMKRQPREWDKKICKSYI